MIRTVRNLLAVIALLAMSAPAAAQWVYNETDDDPFAGGSQRFAAAVARTGEMIGFRCTNEDDLSLMFISNEKPNPEHAAVFRAMTADLLVIVDSDPRQSFSANIDTTSDGDRYRFTGTEDDIAALARKVAGAKKRVAVAVELVGQRVASAVVNVRGSGTSIGKLLKGCDLQ